jgi:hypothetical protein
VERNAISQIRAVLQALRRRMVLNQFLASWARATLFFFGLLVLFRGVAWWGGQTRPDVASLPIMLSWPFVIGALGALIVTALRIPSLATAAERVDRVAGTRDRLVSALAFHERTARLELEQLAIGETARWLEGRDLRSSAPIRCPREVRWLFVPLAMLALLWWHDWDRAKARDAAAAAAESAVSPTVQSLQTVADKLAERAKATGDEKSSKLAERMKQSAAQIRAEAQSGGDAQRAALRELSALEQLVQELRQPQDITPQEIGAIAQTLAAFEETKAAAKDLQENRILEAAKKLDDASQAPNAEKLEAEVRNALEHLARREEQRSKQLEQLQEKTAQSGKEPRALQELAAMLKQAGQKKAAQAAAGQPGKEQPQAGKAAGKGKQNEQGIGDEDLKKLLGSLQEMKDQQQQNSGKEEQTEGDGEGEETGAGSGPVTMLSFQESPNVDPAVEIGVPTGRPGGERDEGTTRDPFASEAADARETRRRERLKGQLGEGESLSNLLPAANSGDAKAVQRYRELTEAAAASAEEAVLQENLPLGSRFLIKRYFQAIRPKE